MSFSGAALAATLALYARQSLLVAYMLVGLLFGPSALGLLNDPKLITEMAHIGIIFLLFLMGLNLQPQELLRMIGKTSVVTLVSSLLFAVVGMLVAMLWQYSLTEVLVIGIAMTFSSTIIGLKLLPTTILHHQRSGEIIISILLLQDFLAIFVLLMIPLLAQSNEIPWLEIGGRLLALPLLIVLVYAFQRFILLKVMRHFDRIREYIFLLAIGWCLGIAVVADWCGLSYEIGAFIAGISLAASPIALFIADSLKALRDFFLVMFFFSLGAGFDVGHLSAVFWPGLVLALLGLMVKPVVFKKLLQGGGESIKRSTDIGIRLGQMSEFSLLIVFVALQAGLIGMQAALLVQFATLLSFILSSYLVVWRLPTPIAISDRLRQD